MNERSDPVEEFRRILLAGLRTGSRSTAVKIDANLGRKVGWRPHVFDERNNVAWHILTEKLESEFWASRMAEAKRAVPKLKLGVALPEHLVYHDDLLQQLNDLDARIAVARDFDGGGEDVSRVMFSNSIADVIYEHRLRLSAGAAAGILDRLLLRCAELRTPATNGVALEVLVAVLLSQVDGFEVTSVGVSNRSQQIDVRVHNRNAAGALGRSEIVIAEAKNWSLPVGTTEYFSVYRKLETRFGRARLGFFVTTDRFTRGVETERLRDSKGDILVVPLDKISLPAIWRGITELDDITKRLEAATIEAASQ